MSKNIVIVGYPKSGSTWLTRLVADLLNCPLKGNWGFDDSDQVIISGMDRQSDFACYKSHHGYNEIFNASKKSIYKIIYLIRDPRDIVISGANFFEYNYEAQGLKAIQSKMISRIKAKTINKGEMIRAVIKGNKSFNKWCEQSWPEHYFSYLNNNVLFIQYEKLIDRPIVECHKILDFLSVQKQDNKILEIIDQQSFKNKKKQAVEKDDHFENHLLRKGSYGYWKNELSAKEKEKFLAKLGNDILFKKLYLDK